MLTRAPLLCLGASSAMYSGDVTVATPIPIPTITLHAINAVTELEDPSPKAPKIKIRLDNKTTFYRPIMSDIGPPAKAPPTAPREITPIMSSS